MLTLQQIESYRRDGSPVIPRLIQGGQLAGLCALADHIVDEARQVTANADPADHQGSICENQRSAGKRFCRTHEEKTARAL